MTEDNTNKPATLLSDALTLRYLDPVQVRIFRTDDGRVRVTVTDDRSLLAPRFMRVCPLNDPDCYISIRTPMPADKELGLLRQWQKLDHESRALLQTELDRRYIYPILRRILSLQDIHGTFVGDFETDRGIREVTLRDIRDNIVYVGNNRILLTDAEGNRYDIPDVTTLDRPSRALLAKIL
jgi:hypothetical protein